MRGCGGGARGAGVQVSVGYEGQESPKKKVGSVAHKANMICPSHLVCWRRKEAVFIRNLKKIVGVELSPRGRWEKDTYSERTGLG